MDVADPTNAAQLLDSTTGIMQPSTGYVMWIDANGGQVGAANLGLNDCSPDSGDSKVEMYVHVGNGGTTFATLDIGTTSSGSLVI